MQNNDEEQTPDSAKLLEDSSNPPLNPAIGPESVPQTTKKTKGPLVVSLVIVSILLFAGLAAAGYFLVFKPLLDSNGQEEPTDNSTLQSPQSVISGVRDALGEDEVTELDANNATLAYRIPGNNFLTFSQEGAAIPGMSTEAPTQEAIDTKLSVAEGVFQNKGLSIDSLSSEEVEHPGVQKFWASAQTVCQTLSAPSSEGAVYNQASGEYDYSSYFLTIQCASLSDFAVTADAAKPFYEAYAKVTENYQANPLFGKQTIKDSRTSGYKTATISLSGYGAVVGGFVGLFYQTPDEVWHYFKGAQAVLSCSEYNTVDIKKAYLGDVCYSGNTESTVSL